MLSEVTTEPFVVPTGTLRVNVDAHEGELKVEILERHNAVLAESAPIASDLPRGEIQWERGDLADLRGQSVRIRFKLKNASLYAYWIEDE